MTCGACGAEASHGSSFCGECGRPIQMAERAAGSAGKESNWIRWAAVSFLVLAVAWSYSARSGIVWWAVMTPLMLGAVAAALRRPEIDAVVEGWGSTFEARRAKAAGSEGKISRYLTRPVFACARRMWEVPCGVPDAPLRAGIRIGALAYFFSVTAVLLAAAAYVVVGLVVAVLLIVAFAWILSFATGQATPRMPRIQRPRGMFGDSTVSNYRKGYEQALQDKDNVAAAAASATLIPLQDGAVQRGYQDGIDGKRFEPR